MYNDEACLCPDAIEKMSKEYFAALNECGMKIVSLGQKENFFFERHVKELASQFFLLGNFCKNKGISKANSSPFDEQAKQLLEWFGLDKSLPECQTQSIPLLQELPQIYVCVFRLQLKMIEQFSGQEFFRDAVAFCKQSLCCMSAFASKVVPSPPKKLD